MGGGRIWEGWFGWVGRGIMDRYGGLEGMGYMRIGFLPLELHTFCIINPELGTPLVISEMR